MSARNKENLDEEKLAAQTHKALLLQLKQLLLSFSSRLTEKGTKMKTKTEIIPVRRGGRPRHRQRKQHGFRGHERRGANVNISSERTSLERVNSRRLTRRDRLKPRISPV